MNVIFAFVQWQFAIDYIENIIIFSRSPQKHSEHKEEVFRLLQEVGMTINLKT